MAFEVWMLTILKIAVLIIGGHLTITKLLPKLKNVLTIFIDKSEIILAIIYALMFYTLILVIKYTVEALVLVNNKYINYLSVVIPATDIMLTIIPFVLYFLIAAVIAMGVKKK